MTPTNLLQFDSGPAPQWLDATADVFVGWNYNPRRRAGRPYEVYIRIHSEKRCESHWTFATWWEAMAFALNTATRHGHYFEGRGGHGIA